MTATKNSWRSKEVQAMYDRLENDYEYRLRSVDAKLIAANGWAGYKRYMRYKEMVIEHSYSGALVAEYFITIHGGCKLRQKY